MPSPSETQRYLKSPLNGEAWPVPPDVDDRMYDALLKAGFEPVKAPKKKASTP